MRDRQIRMERRGLKDRQEESSQVSAGRIYRIALIRFGRPQKVRQGEAAEQMRERERAHISEHIMDCFRSGETARHPMSRVVLIFSSRSL